MNQLGLLMDYTTFHIGIYVSLITAATAVMSLKRDFSKMWTVKLAIGCLMVAGVSGGVIAGNIPLYASWEEFSAARIGPLGVEIFLFRWWAHIEHLSFWLGVLLVVSRLVFRRRRDVACDWF